MNAINKENNRSRILPLIITKIDKLLKVGFIREVKDPKWLRLLCKYCDILRGQGLLYTANNHLRMEGFSEG